MTITGHAHPYPGNVWSHKLFSLSRNPCTSILPYHLRVYEVFLYHSFELRYKALLYFVVIDSSNEYLFIAHIYNLHFTVTVIIWRTWWFLSPLCTVHWYLPWSAFLSTPWIWRVPFWMCTTCRWLTGKRLPSAKHIQALNICFRATYGKVVYHFIRQLFIHLASHVFRSTMDIVRGKA